MVEQFLQRVFSKTPLKNQKQLADVLGVDPSTVSTAKGRGRVPKRWAFLLSDKFGLNTDWLLTGEGEPTKQGLLEAGKPLDYTQQAAAMRQGADMLRQGAQIGQGFDPNDATRFKWAQEVALQAINFLLQRPGEPSRDFFEPSREQLTKAREQFQQGAKVVDGGSLAALVWKSEQQFRALDMREPQMIQHLKGILDARHQQVLKKEEEEAVSILRDSSSSRDYGGLHEPAKPFPYGPKDPDSPPDEQNGAEPSTEDVNLDQR